MHKMTYLAWQRAIIEMFLSLIILSQIVGYAGVSDAAEVVLPSSVQGKWSGVVLTIQNKITQRLVDNRVNLHSDFTIPGSTLRIRVGNFIPDFKMDGNIITSASDRPDNPAVYMEVFEGARMIFKGWRYAKYPAIQPFTHSEFDIIFKAGIPSGNAADQPQKQPEKIKKPAPSPL